MPSFSKREKQPVDILISSAGRRVGLINCFRKAGMDVGIDLRITAVDMTPDWSPACQQADNYFRVPRCTDTEYIDQLLSICSEQKIDLIVPTIDTELSVYANAKHLFDEIGTTILISDKKFISIARDKEKTAIELKNNGINTPTTWHMKDVYNTVDQIRFPVIAKPTDGSRSQGILYFDNSSELSEASLNTRGPYIVQERCGGKEYTINAFFDKDGVCQACVPHLRKYVRDGEVCFAETVRIPQFTAIAKKMSDAFNGIWGNICFQGFMDDLENEVSVFEINARFGGGYPICDKAGGKYAKWIIQDLIGDQPDYNDGWQEGVRMLRYDAAVFL